MNQKKVKIIGLSVKEDFGILRSCNIEFDEKNRLIAIKGEVGAGKTTFKTALELGTLGSDTLKDDKQLYGKINQEVQLMDGDMPVFVGCKSEKSGTLSYVVYTKDNNGKKVQNPIIDGVSITPAKYLKELQTALTWRMDEITSENSTVQRKVLLDLYQDDLRKVGVIFDKNHPDYVGSILDRIEKADEIRKQKDYARKQVGGFASHLKDNGYDVDNPDTLPKPVNVEGLQKEIIELEYDITNAEKNFESEKEDRLKKLVNDSNNLVLFLKKTNITLISENNELKKGYDLERSGYDGLMNELESVLYKIDDLGIRKIVPKETADNVTTLLKNNIKLKVPEVPPYSDLIPMKGDRCEVDTWPHDGEVKDTIVQITALRATYDTISIEVYNADTGEKELQLKGLKENMDLAKDTNKVCESVRTFMEWRDADGVVSRLRQEYIKKLGELDTGVDGLKIQLDELGEKLDIYLMYNGAYSPEYFGNKKQEQRKLSSYSGTQKPMICLLIQNYLLSRKPKALRYLWIDNVPIDQKTRELLENMGEELDLTIFINMTGDFDRKTLNSGEILIDGGEVFFNQKE